MKFFPNSSHSMIAEAINSVGQLKEHVANANRLQIDRDPLKLPLGIRSAIYKHLSSSKSSTDSLKLSPIGDNVFITESADKKVVNTFQLATLMVIRRSSFQ